MIDTHAHLYAEEFDDDTAEALTRALSVGVDTILLPNIDVESIHRMKRLVAESTQCRAMMGLHPCYVKEDYLEQLKVIKSELDKGGYIAVGEIGTDLYWDKTFWKEQQEAFVMQCEWAYEKKLPVAIHCRESIDETIELVRPFAQRGVTGVFHCFSGNLQQAQQVTDMGFYLGIGGVATFKNGGLDKVLPHVDRDRVVLETDSPYLAPVPHRGKRNEPAYLELIAERVAALWNTDRMEVDSITTANARRLFAL